MRNIASTTTLLGNNSSGLQVEIADLKMLVSKLSHDNQALANKVNFKDSEIKEKDSEITKQNEEIKNKKFEILYYQKLLFGQRSERVKYLTKDELQLPLFDEIQRFADKEELKAEIELNQETKEILKERAELKLLNEQYKTTPKKKGRKSFKSSNPNITVSRNEIDIAEEEKKCHCGNCLTKIGEESSETIEHIPTSIKIIENIRFKYACKSCEENIKIAKKVDKVFDKTSASSSLLSNILISKFEDHLPFYRQSKMFKRYGINIDRKLMNNWLFKSAKLFAPLLMELKDEIIKSNYIAVDETPVNTIDKSKTNKAYMWVYQSKGDARKLLYYDFKLNRSSDNARLLLSDYEGYVQTDGYSGYSFLSNNNKTVRLACMAHARRKFYDIAKLIKDPNSKENTIANKALNKIERLYLIEKKIRLEKLSKEKIKEIRLEQAEPILKELYSYAKEKLQITLAGSPIHKALNYFLNQYQYLENYLKDGILDIDNNKTENAIRPFALGRKNWMFVGDEQGGVAAGTIYSLIESAKLNDLHTGKYLKYLFDNLKRREGENKLRELLPHVIDREIVNGWV
jgi:transposase